MLSHAFAACDIWAVPDPLKIPSGGSGWQVVSSAHTPFKSAYLIVLLSSLRLYDASLYQLALQKVIRNRGPEISHRKDVAAWQNNEHAADFGYTLDYFSADLLGELCPQEGGGLS